MPRKAKIVIICHLCMAFTALFWFLLAPWLQEVLVKKEEVALFEAVIGEEVFFSALPIEQQQEIREGISALRRPSASSYASRFQRPLFPLLWIVCSVVLAVLLLFHVQGAAQVSVVLPIIIVAQGVQLYKNPPNNEVLSSLFPTEEHVATHYAPEGTKRLKKKELTKAWHKYLVCEWAQEEPSLEGAIYAKQLKKGAFAFNLARVQRRLSGEQVESLWKEVLAAPPSAMLLLLYFGWNLFFFLYMRKQFV